MFINSIFLPKNISDQTLPEGVAGKLGNFSHLFSNVFRIVKDEQEGTVPFQLANLSAEGTSDTQNELLKVSLLSNNKLNFENTNISMIVAAFLSKLSPGEFTEELADVNKVKINEKTPKYFSLNKTDFVKEIKNIIDSLQNSNIKSLENVEISLVANGQSIKINPLTTNVVALESWVTEQLQSNTDFEIIVKRGQKKLAVDVEPFKNEISEIEKPIQIISINTDKPVETKTNPTSNKNNASTTSISKNISIEESTPEQPLTGLKQTYVNQNGQIIKSEISSIQNQIIPIQKNTSQTSNNINIINKESLLSELKAQGKAGEELNPDLDAKLKPELIDNVKNSISNTGEVRTQNISIPKSDLQNKIISETQNKLLTKSEISKKQENVISDQNFNSKIVDSEKSIDAALKTISSEIKLKTNPVQSSETVKNSDKTNQTSELKHNQVSQSDNKISVKSNQKFNSVSINKNSIQEKVFLNDLIEKTDVRNIDINIQRNIKTINLGTPNIQDEYQPNLSTLKENIIKSQSQSSIQDVDVKKVLSTKPEAKQAIVKVTSDSESVKTAVTINNKVAEKPIVTKTELNNRFVESEFVENENTISAKNEPIKSINTFQQTQKENPVVEPDNKIRPEKNNLEPNKDIKVNFVKAKLEAIENPLTKKIVSPENENGQRIPEQKNNTQKEGVECLETKTSDQSKIISNVNIKETTVSKSASKLVDDNSETTINTKTDNAALKENNKEKVALKTNSNLISKSPEKTEVNTIHNSEKNTSNLNKETTAENLRTSLKEFGSDDIKQESVIKNQFEVVKEKSKETVAFKTNSNLISVSAEKTEVETIQNSEKNITNLKAKTIVENLRASLKEFPSDDIKHEIVFKNQFENKTVKVDFMQRRVYSQIPPLEVMADEVEVKNVKNHIVNVEMSKNENTQSIDEPVKSAHNAIEQKPKNEKQVWVKVSLEKNDNETVNEVRKSSNQQSKITIDATSDGMKKEFDQNNFSEKEPHEYQKSKLQTITAESNQNTEQKSVTQTQPSDNHDSVSNVKVDIKTENNSFKSTLHTDDTKFTSRTAEMVEKVCLDIQGLLESGKTRPGEIVVISPYMSDALRFSIQRKLEVLGIPNRTTRPSRSLGKEPTVRTLLTLAKISNPSWKLPITPFEMREMLLEVITSGDLNRADLLAKIIAPQLNRTRQLVKFSELIPEMQARVTFVVGERYEQMRAWLETAIGDGFSDLDVFFGKLFGELLTQKGFGYHENMESAALIDQLITSARKFRNFSKMDGQLVSEEIGKEYIQMVESGVLAAQYFTPQDDDPKEVVLLAPAYSFLMSNRAVGYQFWLDTGSQGWWERLFQPLTQPYVLSREWQRGRKWSDADEFASNQESMARLVNGLLERCTGKVFFCTTGLNESGMEEKGRLLYCLQTLLKRLPEQGSNDV